MFVSEGPISFQLSQQRAVNATALSLFLLVILFYTNSRKDLFLFQKKGNLWEIAVCRAVWRSLHCLSLLWTRWLKQVFRPENHVMPGRGWLVSAECWSVSIS